MVYNVPGKLHTLNGITMSLENFITSYPQWVYNVPGKFHNIITHNGFTKFPWKTS
jgi:hypothetical protein